MTLLTVLAIAALVVLLLWAFMQWGPGDATAKRGVSLVVTCVLVGVVIVWGIWTLFGHRI